MKKKVFLFVAGIFIAITVFTLPDAGLSESKKMTIRTAPMGGAWYPVGKKIASLIQKYVPGADIKVEAAGGATENPKLVGNGETDLAITNAGSGFAAFKGDKPYAKANPIRSLGYMYPSILHIVVLQDSDIKTLWDLKGKRVGCGVTGGGTILMMKRIFSLIGMGIEDIEPSYLGYEDAGQGMRDGYLDATFVLSGTPASAVTNLMMHRPIRFIEIDRETADIFVEKYPFYTGLMIPKEYYKTSRDVYTVGAGNLLIVNKDMDKEISYKITAATFGHIDEFQKAHPSAKTIRLETAPDSPVPLHPGAARFYKEKGVLE